MLSYIFSVTLIDSCCRLVSRISQSAFSYGSLHPNPLCFFFFVLDLFGFGSLASQRVSAFPVLTPSTVSDGTLRRQGGEIASKLTRTSFGLTLIFSICSMELPTPLAKRFVFYNHLFHYLSRLNNKP